jgi:hypothetical protein
MTPTDERPCIRVTAAELGEKIRRVQLGESAEAVNGTLGGPPFNEEEVSGMKRMFWRFCVGDAEAKREWEDIYLGEFVDGRLVFGSIIPHG